MRFYIIIFIFLSLEYAYNNALTTHQKNDGNSDCLTDELYGDFTDEEYNNLIERRKLVRAKMQNQLYRNETDTLYVPVVFHNLYKIVDGEPIHSYCDYIKGSTKPLKDDDGEILETNFAEDGDYTTGNYQNICNQRIVRSIKILNAQYLPSGVQFQLHPDYHEMQHDTISGFDGFFDNATGDNLPVANDLKRKYNIPNALNIYTTDCLGFGGITTGYTTCASGKNGFSLYPWDLKSNEPGAFIVHKDMPGSDVAVDPNSDDHGNPNISTLAHEIGHFFSLLHINGIWFWDEDNIPRELVDGSDCDIHGDLICDTPGSPGHEPDAWNTEECIYHGYGGEYVDSTGILKIGGYDNISQTSVIYNYCEKWNFVNPYGFEHCASYTNYDNNGEIFGTRGLLEENQECYHYDENDDIDLSEYSTECHINNYLYLPIGHNFMGPVALTQPCAQVGHSDYDNTKKGFTEEQFLGLKTSLELDYTECNDVNACNSGFSIRKGIADTFLLRSGESSCLYPCSKQESEDYYIEFYAGCLNTDAEDPLDYSQYDCSGNLLSLNQNIIPQNFWINHIYPNPFNPTTTIHYSLNKNANVEVTIYDIAGRLITTLINKFQIAGYHSITWDASNYSSGIYFLNMYSGEISETKKLVLIK